MVGDPKKIEFVEISDLHFDPKNPRIPANVDSNDEEEILEWMLDDENVTELMGSIGEQGFFPGEPLLVIGDGKNGKFTVVEGNRRLAALILLDDPTRAPIRKSAAKQLSEEAKERTKNVPIIKYEASEDISDYLGYRHITGIKEWDPISKARHLKHLFDGIKKGKLDDKYRHLAKKIGSRMDYVGKLLTGLGLYEKIEENDFFDVHGLNEYTFEFTLITTALGYSNIANYLGLSNSTNLDLKGLKNDKLKQLTTWIYEREKDGKKKKWVSESRDLGQLSEVVANPEALKLFEEGASLDVAAMLTDYPYTIFKEAVFESKDQLAIANKYLHKVSNPKETIIDILEDIVAMTQDILGGIQRRLSKDD